MPDNAEPLYWKKEKPGFLFMRLYPMRYVCALSCLWSGLALAETTLDPFNTEAMLPLKPALRLGGAVGDPCAEAMPTGALGLLEVVNLALCKNPQTREAWASARVQAAQVGVSKASYLPSPTLTASGSRSRVDAAPSVYQRSIGLNLSYLLYDFGGRAANLESARQLLDAAAATQDSTVQAVFLSAVQAFYQTQAVLAALNAARESERAAKESFSAAEARYATGSATPADKLQAQTAYSQATLNRITADGNMKNAKGALANMLGLDANRNVPLVAADGFSAQQSSFTTPPKPDVTADRTASHPKDASYPEEAEALRIFERDVAALIEEARQRRPDLYAAAAQVKAAEANVDAARAAGKPSISLTASTNQTSSAGVTSRGSSAGITLSVPIFSGFAPTYRIRAAEAQVEAKNAQLERLRLQVALDVWTAYQNLTTATQSLRSTADLLSSAGQSERVALGRYKAGVGSILDVLNAQSALASARQQRIQSTFNWNISRAALAQAMGSLDANLLQTLPDSSQQPGASPPQKKSQP
ncbi:MAG TPA: TolC family protein [Gallionella sp.]|nr:TolC family protein [Gallionella sp.]